jgi:hypothetical protein
MSLEEPPFFPQYKLIKINPFDRQMFFPNYALIISQ